MVAVVAIHVALILMVISVATPMWLEGNLASNATHHNTTHNSTVGNETIPTNYTKVNKGLWNICFDDTCHGVYSFENVDQSGVRFYNSYSLLTYFYYLFFVKYPSLTNKGTFGWC